jgi:hypothetical protein
MCYCSLALLGQGLKKSPIGQKLDFANHHLFMQRSHDNKKIKKPHNRGSVNEISRPICEVEALRVQLLPNAGKC